VDVMEFFNLKRHQLFPNRFFAEEPAAVSSTKKQEICDQQA